MVYGTAQYVTSAIAELEAPPSDLPVRIQEHSFLLGRLLFQKSGTTATQVDTVFETVFTPTQAATHANLSGLSADDHAQYHTDARALTWLGGRSTTDLPEGTNLYYTDVRADARIGLANLEDLADVVAYAALADGEVLQWNTAAGGWRHRTLAEAGISAVGHVHAAGDITSGILSVTRGGIGLADPTAGKILLGAGASAMTQLDFGAAAGYVRSTGAAWARSALLASDLTGTALPASVVTSSLTTVAEAAVTGHEGAIDHDALTNFVAGEHFLQSAITNLGTLATHLLFTDNTYDIGASGATRPRNMYLAGALTISGTIIGTSGTFSDNTAGITAQAASGASIMRIVRNLITDNTQMQFKLAGAEEWHIGISGSSPGVLAFNDAFFGNVITIARGGILTIDGTHFIKERAAAAADVTVYGQLWVKNTDPNELWFTDGDGTDNQVAFV